MSTSIDQDDAAVVREFYDLLKQRRSVEAEQLLHEDLVIDEPQELPFGGIFRGRGASTDILMQITALADFAPVADFEIWGSTGPVVLRLRGRFTSKASGETAESDILELVTVSDGLITRMDIYYKDPGAVSAALAPVAAGARR